ncbi:mannose-6-phosphate isomerase, class I [Bacillus songklensis]|uniref:Mannose-6-phosphate isomerase n=1 Tax=Bacillus songklensis TaxID=1069116 RepID=A0ABV8AXH9_9BACI
MKVPIFLKPVFKERIWGGTALRDEYGYDIPSPTSGECWAISAHPNGPNKVLNGEYEGWTLDQLYIEHPELFGNINHKVFPLLTKIIDANDELSVQVHPDNEYAAVYENGELGKTECWYILSCNENAEIIFGHHAKTKEEFKDMIQQGKWDSLLQRVPVKKGDFFYVPSGTLHALGKGIRVLETQQSSDTTYRVYDYDRVDDNGNKRELHIEKAIAVTTIPHQPANTSVKVKQQGNVKITTFISNEFFTIHKWDLNGQIVQEQNQPFQLVSVIEGEGELQIANSLFKLAKGDHFILPSTVGQFTMKGSISLIVSHL